MFKGKVRLEWLSWTACAALILELTFLGQADDRPWSAVWTALAAMLAFVVPSLVSIGVRQRESERE
jgi:hypothetical protein